MELCGRGFLQEVAEALADGAGGDAEHFAQGDGGGAVMFLFIAVDHRSRLGFAMAFPKRNAECAAEFLRRLPLALPVPVFAGNTSLNFPHSHLKNGQLLWTPTIFGTTFIARVLLP